MKKNKILNLLIYTFSLLIIIVGGIIIYETFFIESHIVSFQKNGVEEIEYTALTCKKSLQGCYVVMPNITKSNGKVLGFSKKHDAHEAEYKMGDKLYIKEDMTLYAVSFQTYTVHIDKNNVDYLETDSISCNAYNEETSCKVEFPLFNKIGYQNAGYSKVKELNVKTASEYYPLVESEVNQNITVYPRYTSFRDDGINSVYQTNSVYALNGSFIEFESSLSQSTINMYKKFLNEISEKAPFLFVGQKINILSSNTFQRTWSSIGGRGTILGICYGSSLMGYPLSRTIDVFYYSKYDEIDNYRTLVHEMSHAFDMYYGYKVNNKVPDIFDSVIVERMSGLTVNEMLNKIYGETRISNQKDILVMFSKYKSTRNRPIDYQGYAYTKNLEFVAEAISWYYMKYLVPSGTYINATFPDDLKISVEYYICVAKNNYNKNAC